MPHATHKRRAEMGAHIGSASIVMIFAVLCLTIFAALSFQTASYEQRLSQKSADAATAYYTADGIAEEVRNKILSALQNGGNGSSDLQQVQFDTELPVTIQQQKDGIRFRYIVPIDTTQALQVQLSWQEHTLRTEQWMVVAAVQWDYDDTIHVWDGEVSSEKPDK